MGNEKYYKRKWICASVNYINTHIISFIWLPFLLWAIGIEISLWFEAGVIFFGMGIYKIIDNKYKTTKFLEKRFESIKFTICFSLLNIILTLLLVFNYQNAYQESRN